MNKIYFQILFISLVLTGCGKTPSELPMESLALQTFSEAITNNKLPGTGFGPTEDTIFVTTFGGNDLGDCEYDSSFTRFLPKKIGKFAVCSIDEPTLRLRSNKTRFHYLFVEFANEKDNQTITIGNEIVLPPDSNFIEIDKGMFKTTFSYKNGNWQLEKTDRWLSGKKGATKL
jgi:hypothetical protein